MTSRRRSAIVGLALAASFPACGGATAGGGDGGVAGGSTGSGTATGTVMGHALDVKDAIALTQSSGVRGTDVFLSVALTSLPGTCAFVVDHPVANPRNTSVISLNIQFAGAATTGTFPVSASGATPGTVNAFFSTYDATCTMTQAPATGGSVTIASIAGGTFRGTYSVGFGADTLAGSFTAPTCGLPDGGLGAAGDGGGPACL